MCLENELHQILTAYILRKTTGARRPLRIQAPDAWSLSIQFDLGEGGPFRIDPLREDDLPSLQQFSQTLGDRTKELFCPYPWNSATALDASFRVAIRQSIDRVDASYLMRCGDRAIGHFFLWKAGGNPHSQAHGVQVPELGVAVSDAIQGRGLGGLCVRLLQTVAESLAADGIELTTAVTNDAGWSTYLSAGFVPVGTIRTPLDVDVTAVAAGHVVASRFRDERQMIDILRPEKRYAVLEYLQFKRDQARAGEPGATRSNEAGDDNER